MFGSNDNGAITIEGYIEFLQLSCETQLQKPCIQINTNT